MKNIPLMIIVCISITCCSKVNKIEIIGNIENQSEIKKISDNIISALIDKDFKTISSYISDNKGLLITMYPVIALEYVPVFSKQEVVKFNNTKEEYKWGLEEGSGEMFVGTPEKFFRLFMNIEPNRISKIGMNTMITVPGYEENQWDVFPNAIITEYYIEPSSEYNGMDWLSIRLIFEKIDSKYYLVGLTSHHLEF